MWDVEELTFLIKFAQLGFPSISKQTNLRLMDGWTECKSKIKARYNEEKENLHHESLSNNFKGSSFINYFLNVSE